jgi:hypothetical protein
MISVQPDDRVLVGLDHTVEDLQLDLLEAGDRARWCAARRSRRPPGTDWPPAASHRHLVQGILDGANIVGLIAGERSATHRR